MDFYKGLPLRLTKHKLTLRSTEGEPRGESRHRTQNIRKDGLSAVCSREMCRSLVERSRRIAFGVPAGIPGDTAWGTDY